MCKFIKTFPVILHKIMGFEMWHHTLW